MFTRGLAVRGVGRLGEFVDRNWKEENWLTRPGGAAPSIIPGVSNTTAAAAAGTTAAAAGGIYLLGKYMKWW
jgi:hypothetical protein